MTHAALSRSLRRPPGVPESECDGELSLTEALPDTVRTIEGSIVFIDVVYIHLCSKCYAKLVEHHGRDGIRLANTIETVHPTPFGLLPHEERRRIFDERDATAELKRRGAKAVANG